MTVPAPRLRAIVATALVGAFLAGAAPVAAADAPTGKYGTGAQVSYSLGVDADADGVLSWGDTIHLTATPPSKMTWAYDIQMQCYAGWKSDRKKGMLVYSAYDWLSTTGVRDYRLSSWTWSSPLAVTCYAQGVFPDGRRAYTFGQIRFTVAA